MLKIISIAMATIFLMLRGTPEPDCAGGFTIKVHVGKNPNGHLDQHVHSAARYWRSFGAPIGAVVVDSDRASGAAEACTFQVAWADDPSSIHDNIAYSTWENGRRGSVSCSTQISPEKFAQGVPMDKIMTHEMGHCLNLEHSPEPTDIMSEDSDHWHDFTKIGAFEQDGIKKNYQ